MAGLKNIPDSDTLAVYLLECCFPRLQRKAHFKEMHMEGKTSGICWPSFVMLRDTKRKLRANLNYGRLTVEAGECYLPLKPSKSNSWGVFYSR